MSYIFICRPEFPPYIRCFPKEMNAPSSSAVLIHHESKFFIRLVVRDQFIFSYFYLSTKQSSKFVYYSILNLCFTNLVYIMFETRIYLFIYLINKR